MKAIDCYILMFSLSLCGVFCALNAAPNQQSSSYYSRKNQSSAEEKYDIMRRNQIDDTDTLAIPLDDSEVEDEEEIDLLEGKEVFPLPQRR